MSDSLWSAKHDEDNDGIPAGKDCDDHDPDPKVSIRIWYRDVDQDGFGAGGKIIACDQPSGTTVTNNDCDDTRKNVYPGAIELCDGLDNDCNEKTDETFLNLGENCGTGVCFGGTIVCTEDHLSTMCSTDGNKGAEICDHLDNNCNGETDEKVLTTYYKDADTDGYGNLSDETTACGAPTGYILNHEDCDDTHASVHPGATELCDGLDNDCNGKTDETFLNLGESCGKGECAGGKILCAEDHLSTVCSTDKNKKVEICDNLDNDCNGKTDEGLLSQFYKDSDTDGYGDLAEELTACSAPVNYVSDHTDCDDQDKFVHPNAAEICDDKDNNCNGQTDEPSAINAKTWYADLDQDGYGNALSPQKACSASTETVANNTDCDDQDKFVHPNAAEICDNVDNNCNGQTDEPSAINAKTWYADLDQDGYGDALTQKFACVKPVGYTDNKLDCNDASDLISPLAKEVCDDKDNNCNGQTDEGVQKTFFQDVDQDGYGNMFVTQKACSTPSGYVSDNADCNDLSDSVHPGAKETCNNVDDNCNGQTDEGVLITYYKDIDQDGYGNVLQNVTGCTAPSGYVSNSADCNDNNKSIHPNAIEMCDNNIDDNCDGITDNALEAKLWYQDKDKDGYGTISNSKYACSNPIGFVANNTDCNDTNSLVHPGATELCTDKIDNNCNGITDSDAKVVTWYKDVDQDGYGDINQTKQDCAQPIGYVENATDCSDTNASVHPGAAEVCNNGLDDNCDGSENQCLLKSILTLQDATHAFLGTALQEYAGWSISSHGDINADGSDDLIIGAYGDATNGPDAGAVSIFFGPLDQPVKTLKNADVVILGDTQGSRTGWSTTISSDISGDGINDLIISAPFFDNSNQQDAGMVAIFFGPINSKTILLSKADIVLYGESTNDTFGFRVSASGDLNQDGKNDLVVSAPNASNGFGEVLIYFGPLLKSKPVLSASNANIKLIGAQPNSQTGCELVSAYDINQDGKNDLLIGAFADSTSFQNAGAVYILFGPILAGTQNLVNASSILFGEQKGDAAGTSLAVIGDINKDGHMDVAIGAPAYGPTDVGAVYIFFGPLKSIKSSLVNADIILYGENAGDQAGSSIAGGFNINLDGSVDLAIGNPQFTQGTNTNTGRVSILLGPLAPGKIKLSEADTQIYGSLPKDQIGMHLLSGYLQKDAVNDLVIAAPMKQTTSAYAGGVYVFHGTGL